MPPRDQNYQYTDAEIIRLLNGRIAKILKMYGRMAVGRVKFLVVSEDADHSRFLQELAKEQSDNRDNYARQILIPYEIGLDHWVGVHLEIANGGKITKAVFLSALAEDASSSSKMLEDRALKIVEAAIVHVHDYKSGLVNNLICKQKRVQDSIVFAIANLSYSYIGANPQNPPTGAGLRVDFNSILRDSQDTIEITVKEVNEEVKDLVMTLTELNSEINGNGGCFIAPKEERGDPTLLRTQYTTVYNPRSKRLELRLDRMYDDKHVANFTRQMPLHTNMSRAAARYIKTAGVGAIGGGVAGLAGGVAFASVESMAGGVVNFGRAALLFENPAVFFASPAFIVPVAVGVVAGGAYEYTSEQAKIFGRTTKEAYTAYLEANKGEEVLDRAAKKLEVQLGLGVDGKWRISNFMRNMHLHDDKITFATVLLAKIYAKQGNKECFTMFNRIIDKNPATNFDAMCLVGLIDMYSDRVRWKLSDFGIAMSEEQREEKLRGFIDRLNDNHIQFIKCYFAMVMDAYAKIFGILTTASFMKKPEEFAEHRKTLVTLTTMPNLHCMRFMWIREEPMKGKPVGKLAEVVFTFAQALTEVMFAEHVKYQHIALGTIIATDSTEYAAITSAVNHAAASLKACTKLITEFKLDALAKSNEYHDIISIISSYVDRYEERNKHYLVKTYSEQNNREDDASADLQIQLSELQKEQAVDNMFRNDPGVTHRQKDMAHRLLSG